MGYITTYGITHLNRIVAMGYMAHMASSIVTAGGAGITIRGYINDLATLAPLVTSLFVACYHWITHTCWHHFSWLHNHAGLHSGVGIIPYCILKMGYITLLASLLLHAVRGLHAAHGITYLNCIVLLGFIPHVAIYRKPVEHRLTGLHFVPGSTGLLQLFDHLINGCFHLFCHPRQLLGLGQRNQPEPFPNAA